MGFTEMERSLLVAVIVSLLVVPSTCCLDRYYEDGLYLCSDSGLTEIPDDIPLDAQEVFLHDNNIGQLNADMFSRFSLNQWEILSFSHNDINIIEPGAFNGLQNLRSLYLNGNHISELKPEMWQGFPGLRRLELKTNGISELKANQWVELGTLKHLNLGNNLIADVPAGAWNGLTNLETLTLSGNNLRQLRGDMWQGLDSLTELNLVECDITSLPPSAFQPLHNLYKLNLDRNKLSSLEGSIWEGLTSIGQLWLNGNQMRIVQSDMWGGLGDTLKWLTIEQNRLQTVPSGAFNTLNSMTLLSLLNNSLTEIRGDMWRGLTSLTRLYLSLNPTREISDDAFPGKYLRNLERLYLTGLNLTTLPSGVFSELTSLKLLKLRYNSLVTLNADIFSPDVLDPEDPPTGLEIGLDKNPIECDSKLCWLKEAEMGGRLKFYINEEPRCAKPPNTKWKDVRLDCDKRSKFSTVLAP